MTDSGSVGGLGGVAVTDTVDTPVSLTSSAPVGYVTVTATDSIELTELLRDWHFEFAQLTPGAFSADGTVLDLGGVSAARLVTNRTLFQRGYAPRDMAAVFLSGAGSGQVFASGQLVGPGECVTLAEGDMLEGITHGNYQEFCFGFDLNACRAQLDALNGGSLGLTRGTTIAAPGSTWLDDMVARVKWLLTSAVEHSHSLANDDVRASLSDHVLAAMARFDSSPADIDSTTSAARASRRVAVRLAREYIHSRLSEPLRLSALCRHAHLKIRSLEYGFREVTGLTPVAYIRSLRLNAVRRALQQNARAQFRSISEIATDAGFWHLSQFAKDYRLFFGETPTETRRRSLTRARGPALTIS
jgi:AraC family transcriptional regulator, ethanolamine operon transcriptional activator